MNKLKWWENPTLFINNFEVKDPIGFDQRLSMSKLSELLWRKDRVDGGGWNRVQLVGSSISSLTKNEIEDFQIMNGGITIANEQLIHGYLNGEITSHFPWWLMLELLKKGIYPEPLFSMERVILKS